MVGADDRGSRGSQTPGKRAEQDRGFSPLSDEATACSDSYGASTATYESSRSAQDTGLNAKLETRVSNRDRAAAHARARSLNLKPSVWQRAVFRDALDLRRVEEFDAAVAAALVNIQQTAQASADARHLARQIRPLAININDLDRRARRGEQVTLSGEAPGLIDLMCEVRQLLGDKVAR